MKYKNSFWKWFTSIFNLFGSSIKVSDYKFLSDKEAMKKDFNFINKKYAKNIPNNIKRRSIEANRKLH